MHFTMVYEQQRQNRFSTLILQHLLMTVIPALLCLGIGYCEEPRLLCTIRGHEENERLGMAMAAAGDVNGDGLADFLVGDAREGSLLGERRCYLYYGKSPLDLLLFPDLVIHQFEIDTLEPGDDHFGEVVGGGEDIDSDGFDDLVITSPEWFWATGKTYLYRGGPSMDSVPDVAISACGSSWMTQFWSTGLRGRVIRDVNGDGYDELVCLVSNLTSDVGAYVYFGGAPMDSTHDIGFQGPGYPGLMLGRDIAHGDVNGDGYVDVVVGAYGHSGQQDAACVYFGGTEMDEIADVQLVSPGEVSDYAVTIPGDLDGDGFDDIAVAQTWSEGHLRGFVFFGGSGMDGISDLSFTGRFLWSTFSLTGGDLNLDGFADLVVAEKTNFQQDVAGRISIYFGGAEMDSFPDHEIEGPYGFAESIAFLGDMTGDGWPEFAVSNPAGAGEIYIYTMGEVSGDGPRPSAMNLGELRIVPNPSNGMTMIGFDLSDTHTPTVGIYDLAGHLVRRLHPGRQETGRHWVLWDGQSSLGRRAPVGTYVVTVQDRDQAIVKRIVLSR